MNTIVKGFDFITAKSSRPYSNKQAILVQKRNSTRTGIHQAFEKELK